MEEEKELPKLPEEKSDYGRTLEEGRGLSRRRGGSFAQTCGRMATFITIVAVAVSLIHLYAAIGIIITAGSTGDPRYVRAFPMFLGFSLV